MAIWFVPLGTILDAHGMNAIKPYAFAANAVAAFISPLMFGAMADRHVAPAKVLRWLACATAITMAVIATAIKHGWNPWLVLALIQIFSLSYAPMFSISTALVLARLENAQKEFGPVRALATIGWMCGALLIGLLNLDRSPLDDVSRRGILAARGGVHLFSARAGNSEIRRASFVARTARPRRADVVERPRHARRLHRHDAVQHSHRRVLSVCADASARPRLRAHERVDEPRASHGDHRDVQPRVAAASLAVEMDFRLRPRLRRFAFRVERAGHKKFAAARRGVARRVVRARVHHRADLFEPPD